MTSRSPLRSQIKEAWRQSITDDYVAQRINSEAFSTAKAKSRRS